LFDSGPGSDRILIFGDRTLLAGLERSKLWLADGTFKLVPNLYFQLYSIHFEFVGGCNPAAVYCLLSNKTRNSYDRVLQESKTLIPAAAPEVILTDFETAAMQAFGRAYCNATISGCYFHLCQSVVRKVSEIGLNEHYSTDDEIRGFIRCLPALAHVPPTDVCDAFETLTENAPEHEKMNEIISYFEHTYIRGRRLQGRVEQYGPALFPIATWNKHSSAADGIARSTNIVEGWHHGLQSLFMCSHPSMWTFCDGLLKDIGKQKAAYLQAVSGAERVPRKSYRLLKDKVARAVNSYNETDILTYLRAIAHLSHA